MAASEQQRIEEKEAFLLEAAMRHVDEAVLITTTELDSPGPPPRPCRPHRLEDERFRTVHVKGERELFEVAAWAGVDCLVWKAAPGDSVHRIYRISK